MEKTEVDKIETLKDYREELRNLYFAAKESSNFALAFEILCYIGQGIARRDEQNE